MLRSFLAWLTREQEGISRVCVRDSGKTFLDSSFGEVLTTCSKLEVRPLVPLYFLERQRIV